MSNMSGHEGSKREVRIRNVRQGVFDALHNIAANKGVTINDFMKMNLDDIVEKYPLHFRQKPKKD